MILHLQLSRMYCSRFWHNWRLQINKVATCTSNKQLSQPYMHVTESVNPRVNINDRIVIYHNANVICIQE